MERQSFHFVNRFLLLFSLYSSTLLGNPLAIENTEEPAVVNFVQVLSKAGLNVKIVPNIDGIIWTKVILVFMMESCLPLQFMINIMNAVNALAGCSIREMLTNYYYRQLCKEAILESICFPNVRTDSSAMRVMDAANIKSGESLCSFDFLTELQRQLDS